MKRFAGGPLFIAIVISGAALAWRLCGIGWGFPDVYEEATSVRKAWGFWGWDGKPFDFNPHFFNYPSFHFYLQFGVQAIVRLFGKLSGRVPDEAAFRAAYYLKPALFVGAGRFLTALLGSLSVFFLYWTGRRLGGARVAVPAALFLALHAVHVEKSRYVEVDVAMTFFVVLSTFYLAGAASGPARRGLFPGSAAIGLAAATKYPGALFLLHVPMAAWLAGRPDPRRVLLALLLAASVFAAASPYVLLDRSAFLRDFGAESVHMQEGHFGGGEGGPLGALRLFAGGFGWPLFVVSVLGLIASAWKPAGVERLLVPLPVLFFVLLSASRTQAPHYPLPVVPSLALAASLLLSRALPSGSPRARLLHPLLVILLLVFPAYSTAKETARLARKDTRTEAREWIEKHVPAGALVLVEPHGPNLLSSADLGRFAQSDEFETVRDRLIAGTSASPWFHAAVIPSFSIDVDRAARFYRFEPYQWFEYVVLTGEIRGRYLADPVGFPVQGAFYREVERRLRPAARVPSDPSRNGPEILIFRRDPSAPAAGAVRLDPDGARDAEYLDYFRAVAGLYRDRGRPDGAAAIYRALLELNPNDAETLRHLGVLTAALGDAEGGARLLDRAVRIDGADRTARMTLGVLLCQAGRLDEGTSLLRALLDEREEDAEVHGNLAAALVQAGRVPEAVLHLNRFLELEPRHPRAGEVRALLESLDGSP